jgi:hypothetical protein
MAKFVEFQRLEGDDEPGAMVTVNTDHIITLETDNYERVALKVVGLNDRILVVGSYADAVKKL